MSREGTKVLFSLSLRQTTGFVTSLLKLAGLDWLGPDYSTLCRRQQTLAVQPPYRGSGSPLHLLIDSTGIRVRGEGEWHARKRGGARRRMWRKLHLAVDESKADRERPRWGVSPTNMAVRAVEIFESGVGDGDGKRHRSERSPKMLPGLLSRLPEGYSTSTRKSRDRCD